MLHNTPHQALTEEQHNRGTQKRAHFCERGVNWWCVCPSWQAFGKADIQTRVACVSPVIISIIALPYFKIRFFWTFLPQVHGSCAPTQLEVEPLLFFRYRSDAIATNTNQPLWTVYTYTYIRGLSYPGDSRTRNCAILCSTNSSSSKLYMCRFLHSPTEWKVLNSFEHELYVYTYTCTLPGHENSQWTHVHICACMQLRTSRYVPYAAATEHACMCTQIYLKVLTRIRKLLAQLPQHVGGRLKSTLL